MVDTVDCVVIGAGVVGLAVAGRLAQRGLETLVLEAEIEIGTGISSRNSEGIHAGIYRPVNAREIADMAWSVLLGSLDAAEMHTNIGLGNEALAARTERALQLIESALAPNLPDLRAVA